ncbi:hypothetical protein K435DRAFT_847650 [Dendrothele bispora CBS 962.96]|uniref:Condensation domain-containing protein n=1 Tax=Dendrothele bispora (strain CBS 962.96) TaxID=1314807 RepID=A0A4S8MXI8_DENBC|nr:hypothetical protein K435DRAFT_847650 [Dendrothele bispora CBS 962.96]
MAATLWDHLGKSYRRPLGDSEYSYFPASQNNGVGDMFLHLAFRAPAELLQHDRVATAWAVIRSRHPLLMSSVVLDQSLPNVAFFEFTPPETVEDAISEAKTALVFTNKSEQELISDYMNGPRTLSNDHLSYLIISIPSGDVESAAQATLQYDLLMCAPHFVGDGSSLHQCTHELFALLASPLSNAQISEELLNSHASWNDVLPPALESRLPVNQRRFAKAAAQVNYAQTLRKEIGGHVFSRTQRAAQRTVSVEMMFDEAETASILRNCKAQSVTVNHALFVLCNFAWSRSINLGIVQNGTDKPDDSSILPTMMYTAINLRPYLSPHPASTYWFLALTYFNIVLPSFLPQQPQNVLISENGNDNSGTSSNNNNSNDISSIVFWHRARSVKAQTRKTVQSPFLTARALESARTRASRVRGITVSVPGANVIEKDLRTKSQAVVIDSENSSRNHDDGRSSPQVPPSPITATTRMDPAPSLALMGLSLIGNLDSTYLRDAYPSIQLVSVRTASRQKSGGLLLLEHTFGKKLWLQMFWDENGFKEGQVEVFWERLKDAVYEFLV